MNIRSLILPALVLVFIPYYVMNHEHKITHIICIGASMFFVCLYFILFSYKYFWDTCRIYLYWFVWSFFLIPTVPLFLQYVCAVFLSCFVPCCAVPVHIGCPRLRWLRLCGFGFLLGNTTFLIWFAISMLCYQYWLVCSFGLIHVCSAFVCAKTSRRRTRSSQLSGHWNCCFIQKKISKHF